MHIISRSNRSRNDVNEESS